MHIILAIFSILPAPIVDHAYLDKQQEADTLAVADTESALATLVSPQRYPAMPESSYTASDVAVGCQGPAAPVIRQSTRQVTRYRRGRSHRGWRRTMRRSRGCSS